MQFMQLFYRESILLVVGNSAVGITTVDVSSGTVGSSVAVVGASVEAYFKWKKKKKYLKIFIKKNKIQITISVGGSTDTVVSSGMIVVSSGTFVVSVNGVVVSGVVFGVSVVATVVTLVVVVGSGPHWAAPCATQLLVGVLNWGRFVGQLCGMALPKEHVKYRVQSVSWGNKTGGLVGPWNINFSL